MSADACGWMSLVAFVCRLSSAADLILNTPADEVQQPRLEPTDLWVIYKIRQPPRDSNGGFLHNFFNFVRGQSRFLSEETNQPAINSIEILPSLLVIARLEASQ